MPYITTSRNVKQNTRRLARSLCLIFPNCIYENRGKKNFDMVAKRALKLGHSSVLFIYESHGNPSLIEKVELNDKEEWEITETICFNSITINRPKKDMTRNNIEFIGEVEFFNKLMNYEEPKKKSKENTIVKYEKRILSIESNNEKIIVLKLV